MENHHQQIHRSKLRPAYNVKNIPAMSEAQIDAETNPTATDSGPVHAPHLWRLFLYSGIGIFAFFIPFTVGEKNTILLDHIVSWIIATLGPGTGYLALAAIVAGTIYQFVSGRWREDYARTIFAFLSILAVVLCAMLVFDFGPAFLHNPHWPVHSEQACDLCWPVDSCWRDLPRPVGWLRPHGIHRRDGAADYAPGV